MDINELLKSAHAQGASGPAYKSRLLNPILRIDGPSLHGDCKQVQPGNTLKIAFFGHSPGQREIFKNGMTSTWHTALPGLGRTSGAISLFRGGP